MLISDWSSDVCSSDLQVRHVEFTRLEATDDVVGHRLSIGELEILDMAQIDLVDDLLGKDALDDRPALLADQVEENRLPFRLKLFGPLAGSADDVGVERAGEASLRRGDDQQMDLIIARPCEQLRDRKSHVCTPVT